MSIDTAEPTVGTLLASGRYELLQRIGRGAVGNVFRARDHARNVEIALKTVVSTEPTFILSLKSEFRRLPEMRHRNLVRFYELVAEGEPHFFTMELIDGVDLQSYVWQSRTFPGLSEALESRLISALPQLADGMCALHAQGELHRDIKPSNIMVSTSGRVVLLDFGLATSMYLDGLTRTIGAGTPRYWAPEQIAGQPGPHSDWFSVGVTVFHLLTGTWVSPAIMVAPDEDDWAFLQLVPERYRSPLRSLLTVEPHRRGGAECIDALVDALGASPAPANGHLREPHSELVGRETELAALATEFEKAPSRPHIVHVVGESGIGKTTLVRTFLASKVADRGLVALTGRCRRNETVQFRAIDPLVDGLARYLSHMPPHEVISLIPRSRYAAPLLSRFPVLGVVEALAALPEEQTLEPIEARRRALSGLRDLLLRLGDRRRVVMWIDDAQWGDLDSVLALRELLKGDEPPNVFIILSYRSGDHPFVEQLRDVEREFDITNTVLPVSPLDDATAAALFSQLAGTDQGSDVRSVVAQAGGSPFLIGELSRLIELRSGVGTHTTLHSSIGQRLEQLPEKLRELVEVVATANHPLPVEFAVDIVNGSIDSNDIEEVSSLCWINVVGDDETSLEPYHDRLREAVVDRMDAHRRQSIHLAIAGRILDEPSIDSALKVEHCLAGGDTANAFRFAVAAAEEAASKYAFDQAVHYYRIAVGAASEPGPDLMIAYANALSNSGRSDQAASVLTELISAPLPIERLVQIRMQAASEHMKAANLIDAHEIMKELLPELGFQYSGDIKKCLRLARWYRIQSLVLSLIFGFDERPGRRDGNNAGISQIIGLGLRVAPVAHAESEIILTRALRTALLRGNRDVRRYILFYEGTRQAAIGKMYARNSRKVLREASRVWRKYEAQRRTEVNSILQQAHYTRTDAAPFRALLADRELPAAARYALIELAYKKFYAAFCLGAAHYFLGEWRRSRLWWRFAEDGLRRLAGGGIVWELAQVDEYLAPSLIFAGAIEELNRRLDAGRESARIRGDVFADAVYETALAPVVALAHDNPGDVVARMTQALDRVRCQHYVGMHIFLTVNGVRVLLYQDQPQAAWDLVERHWSGLVDAGNFEMEMLGGLLRFARLCAAVALANHIGRQDERFKALVGATRDEAGHLKRSRLPHATGFAHSAEATIAALVGERKQCIAQLEAAIVAYQRADMPLMAAATRLQLGSFAADRQTRTDTAEQWLRDHGIVRPDKFASAMIPPIVLR